jgi:hypothetical protein
MNINFLYSSILRNIRIYSSVTGAQSLPTLRSHVLYIPRLTEEHKAICSLVNRGIYWICFYISLVLVASPDGEPPK